MSEPAMRYVVAANVPLKRARLHDGTIIEAQSTQNLRRKVSAHLLGIGYRADNFERYFQNAVCDAWPDEVACHACRFIDDRAPEKVLERRDLRLVDVVAFLETVFRWLKEGKFVDDSEARRRSVICAQCTHNREIQGCSSCSNAFEKIKAVLGKREVPNASMLRGCDVCGCSLPVKILVPKEALRRKDHEWPAHCWMNEVEK